MPHMYHANSASRAVDHEEDAIHARAPAIQMHTNRIGRIQTFRRDGTSLWILIQSENGLLEPIEPGSALMRCLLDDPQVELLKFSLGTRGDINAVSHARGEGG